MSEDRNPQSAIRNRGLFWCHAALLIGFAALSLYLLSTPTDDAFISFRYLHNWLHGDGLVFNAGERVEGYSNFLWIALLAIPASFGVRPEIASPEIEWFLAFLCLALTAVGARRIVGRENPMQLAAPLMVALSGSFLFWIGKGLEVMLYSALHLGLAVAIMVGADKVDTMDGTDRREHGIWGAGLILGLLAAGCALTRPEGAAAPAVVLAALAAAEWRKARNGQNGLPQQEEETEPSGQERRCGQKGVYVFALGLLIVAVAGQFLFRHIYYGHFLPNTYYAKRLDLATALGGGLGYLRKFAAGPTEPEAWFYGLGWTAYLPVWVACATAVYSAVHNGQRPSTLNPQPSTPNPRLWPLALQFFTLIAVVVYVGGDWMPGFRFLVPAIPLGCLLVGAGLGRLYESGQSDASKQMPRNHTAQKILAVGALAIVLAVEAANLFLMVRSPEFARWKHHIRNYGPMAAELSRLAPKDSLVALSDIGIISYFNPDLRFIDVLGLTDPEIASLPGIHYQKTDLDYILSRKPDFVLAMLFRSPKQDMAAKTEFDRMFFEHVSEAEGYEDLEEVFGWREGLRGKAEVSFVVFGCSSPAAPVAGPK